MGARMAVWRSRLEAVALVVVAARFIDFGADTTSAMSWGYGSLGDWFGRLSGYPLMLPGLVLLVPLTILVVTRILYSWPKGTPMRTALITSLGAWVMGIGGVVASSGCAITQLARIGRAAEYNATAPAFVAGAFYALAGLVTHLAALALATWLLRELMRDRPARPTRMVPEPESGPAAQV
jgi:hypothetical protein